MKRLLSLIFSSVLLIVLAPLLALIAVLIRIDSPGPIIFVQKRIGKDEKLFNMYKFRTMKVNTPEVATELLGDMDKYTTKIGFFLRKSSLDEIPNIINIFMGEMSFVGPRPALYNQYELIEKRREKGINKLLPGLTGLAQINGRDNLSDDEKVMYDELYLLEKSFFTDLRIIFKTFTKVAACKDVH